VAPSARFAATWSDGAGRRHATPLFDRDAFCAVGRFYILPDAKHFITTCSLLAIFNNLFIVTILDSASNIARRALNNRMILMPSLVFARFMHRFRA
jgi:hypothetical protein